MCSNFIIVTGVWITLQCYVCIYVHPQETRFCHPNPIVFDGIHTPASPMSINVTAGQDVALLCGVSGASPPPVIEWLDNRGVIAENFDFNRARYLNGGRYLLLHALIVEQINRTYRCRITNGFIYNIIESTGSYTLNNLGKLLSEAF